jgi:transcription antitermination factor NusG
MEATRSKSTVSSSQGRISFVYWEETPHMENRADKGIGQPLWYALIVKPRHEKAAEKYLEMRCLEAFLPLYKSARTWSDRIRTIEMPLFPGYVFCRFDYASRMTVLNAPSVMSIVGFGGNEIPVSEAEILAIKEILASGLPVRPWPYIQAGERVRIHSGALQGTEGIVVREKSCVRIVISVELLQRSIAVEVDRSMIECLPERPRRPVDAARPVLVS